MAHDKKHNIIDPEDHFGVVGQAGEVLTNIGDGSLAFAPVSTPDPVLANVLAAGRFADANGAVNDNSNIETLNLNSRILKDSAAKVKIDWQNKKAYDFNGSSDVPVIDWEISGLQLSSSDGTASINWGTRKAIASTGFSTIDWDNKILEEAGTGCLMWGANVNGSSYQGIALPPAAVFVSIVDNEVAIDSNQRFLSGPSANGGLDWNAIATSGRTFIKQSIPNEDISVNGGGIGSLEGYMFITETVPGPGGSGFLNIQFRDSTGEPFTVQLAYS